MKLVVNNTHRPVAIPHEYPDYPVGVRFVPHVPKPLHTTDELIFAAWLGGFAGVLVTLGAAFVWSLVL